MMTAPWAHQTRQRDMHLDLWSRGKGAANFSDMGAGKSRTAIECLNETRPHRTLVLAPKSVASGVWRGQLEQYATFEPIITELSSGPVKDRAAQLKRSVAMNHPLVVVTNYEAIPLKNPFGEYLASLPWDALICDEFHRCKSPSGKQSRMVAKIAWNVRHRLELTGTPVSGAHGPLGIWAQYRAIEPSIFPRTYTQFKGRYTRPATWKDYDVVLSVSATDALPFKFANLEDLKDRMWSIATRVETADVIDLPDHVDLRRVVDLEPEARRIYRKLEKDLISDVADGTVTAANALVRILRLQQTTGGTLVDDEGILHVVSEAKQRLLQDVLTDIDPTEPVAAFGRFHSDLDAIRTAAIAAGRPVLEISGRVNQYADWTRSNGHGTAPLIAVQIQAGSLGITLVQARYAIFYSLNHSLGDYDQCRARVLRPGQGRAVTYVHLVATGTIDEKIYQALEKREDVVRSVIGGLR